MHKEGELKLRNENGFGSIVKLSGARRKPYGVRITTGWKDGKQIRKYLGYYKTQHEALIALAEFHQSGVNLDLTNITLKELFEKWLSDQEKRNIADGTKRNQHMAYNHLGELASMTISKIKAVHLQKWMDGIDLKPSTKGKVKSTIGQVYEYAVQNDIVTKNYAKFIKIEEKIEKTGAVFTEDEIKTLWKNSDDLIARILLILIYTGMRIGELLQMNKDTINLDECYVVGGSKTDAGRDRVIPLHQDIIPLVKTQLGENKWFVQSNRGNAVSYSNIIQTFNAYMEKLGMSHKFHDARKTAISLMHSSGIPMETIKIIVGHAGTNVTEKIYLFKNKHELVKVINTIKISK